MTTGDPSTAKALPQADATPHEVVPARMINELLYCERLMYLEWVQGQWADNFFTVDGKRVHKRADRAKALRPVDSSQPSAKEPTRKASKKSGEDSTEAATEELPYQARSVWLTSERLGLTAKVDVIDVEGGRVVPVEYKRGKQPSAPEGAWLPERAQLCAQVLLLREHGYTCEEAMIYFAEERKRVPITIDDQLIATVEEAVQRARQLASTGVIPPPLVDSPKCKGCSLVGICLPDEVNLLANVTANPSDSDSAAKPRRLAPARDDRLPLYIQEQGARLRLKGECLLVESREDKPTEARLANTSQVCLFGNVQTSTQALRELLSRQVPVSFFTTGGWLVGRAVGMESKNIDLKLAQYRATTDPATCLKVASTIVSSKILNCRTLLRRNAPEPSAVCLSSLKQLARKSEEAPDLGSLLGIEGSAARAYFEQFTSMLKVPGDPLDFAMNGRNRRPPRDPINALLSFAYSLLAKELTIALTNVGLDPMLGFYHQPHFGRPGLALDLMEEFRPLIADSVVVGAINNGVVTASDFLHAAGSVSLKPYARRRFLLAFERRMDQLVTHPVFDYRVSYRRVLELQARLLSRMLLGEIGGYPPFRTR